MKKKKCLWVMSGRWENPWFKPAVHRTCTVPMQSSKSNFEFLNLKKKKKKSRRPRMLKRMPWAHGGTNDDDLSDSSSSGESDSSGDGGSGARRGRKADAPSWLDDGHWRDEVKSIIGIKPAPAPAAASDDELAGSDDGASDDGASDDDDSADGLRGRGVFFVCFGCLFVQFSPLAIAGTYMFLLFVNFRLRILHLRMSGGFFCFFFCFCFCFCIAYPPISRVSSMDLAHRFDALEYINAHAHLPRGKISCGVQSTKTKQLRRVVHVRRPAQLHAVRQDRDAHRARCRGPPGVLGASQAAQAVGGGEPARGAQDV
jgi:hypothetical protein